MKVQIEVLSSDLSSVVKVIEEELLRIYSNFAYVGDAVYCIAEGDDDCCGYRYCARESGERLTEQSLALCRSMR